MFRFTLVIGLVVFALIPALRADDGPGIDTQLALRYFEEARQLSERDGGKLWGQALYGPMLFLDPQSSTMLGNQADPEGHLQAVDGVFVGPIGEDLGFANTAQTWSGIFWTTMIWPLPKNRYDRQRLMAHELFHRIQTDIGCPMASPDNEHLDSRDGRIWMRMELRALVEALIRSGDEKRQAVEDALLFRAYRQSLFADAAEEERALELNEGLAEYTGLKLSGLPEGVLADRAAVRIARDEPSDNFTRSFAYASGPPYGLLLDHAAAAGTVSNWRAAVSPEANISHFVKRAYSVRLPDELPPAAVRRALQYDGPRVIAEEKERAETRRERMALHRARFIDGPVLVLPASGDVGYSFNPYGIASLPGVGQVYETVSVTDEWGALEVDSGGALMLRDESGRVSEFRVPAPADPGGRPLAGDGWTLKLAEGWQVAEGKRAGDYLLRPAP